MRSTRDAYVSDVKLLSLLLMATVGLACAGAPGPGDVITESDLDRKATGQCPDTRGQGRPLVVDWDSVDRAELEARAQRGPVVVAYEGCRIRVLPRCTVKSASPYAYVGLTPKKDVITMRDAAEIYANVPVSAAKLEAKLAKQGSLVASMTIVGQLDTPEPAPARDRLEGDCEGASHVVTALTVGAFEFTAAKSIEGAAGVEVLGAGAGTKMGASGELLNKDGDAAACDKASGTDQKAPFGCGALLRIEVVPLGAPRNAEPSCPSGMQWDGAQCIAVAATKSCPADHVADKVKGCVRKKEDAVAAAASMTKAGGAHVAPVSASCTDMTSCQAACDKGDAKGCAGLGGLLRQGLKAGAASDDGKRASQAFEKACATGEPTACTALGEMLYQGLGVPKDAAASIGHLEKGCEGGDPAGCNDVGLAKLAGPPPDPAGAAKYFERACNERSSLGCLQLGLLVKAGRGVVKDAARGQALLEKACAAKVGNACQLAGK
jgi:hypothetical protein